MIYSKISILAVFLIMLFSYCNNTSTNRHLYQSVIIQDTLVKDQFVFSNPQISKDTFKIISQSSYFYYCFGEFDNPSLLIKNFSQNFAVKKEITTVFNDPNMLDTLYRICKSESFIKFVYSSSDEFLIVMDIVSGRIAVPEFVMTNGIKVGQDKNVVLREIFGNNIPESIESFDNLQIITALTGLWIDFKFTENRLLEIKINSDMQVDKK